MGDHITTNSTLAGGGVDVKSGIKPNFVLRYKSALWVFALLPLTGCMSTTTNCRTNSFNGTTCTKTSSNELWAWLTVNPVRAFVVLAAVVWALSALFESRNKDGKDDG